MTLVVGTPVWRREWVLGQWFWFLEQACKTAEIEPSYVFVVDTRDHATEQVIRDACATHGRELHVVHVNEDQDQSRTDRSWNTDRYRHMVWLRNTMLAKVRELDPDLFLSLDSDVLLHADAIGRMIGLLDERTWVAVGSKCYLEPIGTRSPNYAFLHNYDALARPDSTHAFGVDVIMAIKLMTRLAYTVDYEFHRNGEDIGWSKALTRRGGTLGWDGGICSKHVMLPAALGTVDPRCGY
jgi:hypothetical protein